jgi:hypothetical protein
MGTCSVIAATTADTERGRYVHWDGYPTGVGQAILDIVRRDGLDKARTVLTAEHFGWSSVTGDDPESDFNREPTRFEVVPGYGIAYTHTEHHDEWAQPIDSEEYGYTLDDDALVIYDGHTERTLRVGWNLDEAEQTALVNHFENGA